MKWEQLGAPVIDGTAQMLRVAEDGRFIPDGSPSAFTGQVCFFNDKTACLRVPTASGWGQLLLLLHLGTLTVTHWQVEGVFGASGRDPAYLEDIRIDAEARHFEVTLMLTHEGDTSVPQS